jgi:hypothetical protein
VVSLAFCRALLAPSEMLFSSPRSHNTFDPSLRTPLYLRQSRCFLSLFASSSLLRQSETASNVLITLDTRTDRGRGKRDGFIVFGTISRLINCFIMFFNNISSGTTQRKAFSPGPCCEVLMSYFLNTTFLALLIQ